MGSLALSRVAAQDPAPTIADEVARLARHELAPLASAIDAGSVYPAEFLRRVGGVGAWSSHVPQEGPADLRCAIQAMAAIGARQPVRAVFWATAVISFLPGSDGNGQDTERSVSCTKHARSSPDQKAKSRRRLGDAAR